jgi:putative ABC transport system permease protein
MILKKIPLAWLQLIRQKGRFLVALSGIAFADILMLMQLGFETALYDSNTRLHQVLKADLVLIEPESKNLANLNTIPRRRLFQASSLKEVKSVEPLYAKYAIWNHPNTKKEKSILVLGFNTTKPAFDLPEVNQKLTTITYPDTLVFDRASRGDYQQAIALLDRGELVTTELEKRKIKLKGLYKVGASFATDGSVMTSDQNFLRIFSEQKPEEVNLGLITLKQGADSKQVANKLRFLLPNDTLVLTHQEFIEFEKKYWRENTAIGFIFTLGTAMGFIVGTIIVYQILYSDVNDHLDEYATLKAMGYRGVYLLGVVFQEALILALLSYIPGIAISLGLYNLTSLATNLPLYMTLDRAGRVLIMTILMCATSGAIAIRKLQQADPADIF